MRLRARAYRFLYDRYGEHAYYWEVCIMARKAALVTVLSLVPVEEGRLRVWIGLGVLQVPLLLQLKFRPFRTALQNRLEEFALIATFLTLFVGAGIGLEIIDKPGGSGETATECGIAAGDVSGDEDVVEIVRLMRNVILHIQVKNV